MNITFLIGNGFDLNLGLKTNYSDFLSVYTSEKNDNPLIQDFKRNMLADKELWSNVEEAFGKVTKDFKSNGYTAEDFCYCHEDFCNCLVKYLIDQEKQIDYSSITNQLAKAFSSSLLKYDSGFRTGEKNRIKASTDTVGGGLRINFLCFNYTTTLDKCISAVRRFPNILGARHLKGSVYSNEIGQSIHVHGTVHQDTVLGVNDITQITDCSLFDGYDDVYMSQIIKQKTNEINEQNTDANSFELLKKSDLIYIYGMSIGTTDNLWWERICNILNTRKHVHLIIHEHNAPKEGIIRTQNIIYAKKECKRFVDISSLSQDEKEEISSRIHIDGTNIFDALQGMASVPENIYQETAILA